MDRKLEARIARLEKSFSTANKFEDVSSNQFISSAELSYIVASLAGLSGANSILKNEKETLERIANKYNGKVVRLDLPIVTDSFNGDLYDLLADIFDNIESIKRAAEKASKYYSSIRDRYNL